MVPQAADRSKNLLRMTPAVRTIAFVFTVASAAPAVAAAQTAAPAARPIPVMPAPRLDTLLDLETVIQRALAVSPAVASAREGVRTARSASRVAFGEYTPSVFA